MIPQEEVITFCPENRQQWREWLRQNHILKKSVWLIYYKKKAKTDRLTWSEAVDEAICFGWIDSLAKTIDQDRYMQLFSKRKPASGWSKINKEKVKKLIADEMISPAGLAVIELAKENGSWTLLDKIEEMAVPDDLAKQLLAKPEANLYFQKLSRSNKRILLHWVTMAKRPETRQKRINEILQFTDQHTKPAILRQGKASSG